MKSLNPVGGRFYGHLFENLSAGIPLGLYWAFEVDFEPLVDNDGDEWPCIMMIEWLSWPIQRWHQLDGCTLATTRHDCVPEVSLYAYSQHQPVSRAFFKLSVNSTNGSHIQGTVLLDLQDPVGAVASDLEINFSVDITFTGLIVVPGNLVSKPTGVTDATAALAPFIDVSDFNTPEFDETRWIFKPRA